ncbi:MAG: S41 family peptidase [Calditrichaceae bacterium]
MKKLTCSLFLVIILFQFSFAVDEARFMEYPDIHGDKIVFTWDNDLWLADSHGGQAVRITTNPGNEFSARFSPDGQWIAFTGNYDGETSIYLIPSEGGEPKRLTYNPWGGRSITWTPDSKKIVYASYYETFIQRDPNLYYVNIDGSAPERLPIDRGVLCSFSGDGTKMLYNRKGRPEYYWKRYKGGQYTDIWMYDFIKNEFSPVSDYVGKNAYPMWIGDNMYFVSDRDNGIANIYAQNLKSGAAAPITNYSDVDVMMPETDGKNIIYTHDGYIHLLPVGATTPEKLTIMAASDKWRLRDRTINPKEYIQSMDISNDGQTVIFDGRGDVITVAVKDGKSNNLTFTPGSRERYPVISPDGQWIAFFSDKSGEYQLYIQKTTGGEWIQLTDGLNRTNYHPVWSPDGTKILFGNKDFSIFYVDVKTKNLVKVDESNQLKNDEFYWEISDYNWSPDSKWITYSLVQFNRNSKIFIYNLEKNKKYALTGDFYDNLNPRFDTSGMYLYYISSRNFDIQMDFYEDNHVVNAPQQIMVVQLQAGQKPPFADSISATQKSAPDPYRIDIEGIKDRTYPLPVPAGNYFYLRAGNGNVLWCSVPKFTSDEYDEIFNPAGKTKWDLHIFDMDKKEETILNDKIKDYRVSSNGENIILSKNDDFFSATIDAAIKDKSAGDKIDLNNMQYQVDSYKEWNQIFSDTWRWYRDFFYDANMHGQNWKAIGDRYRAYIPYLTSRDQLNWALEQMVGELSVSHTYVRGGDNGPELKNESKLFTGWIGADLTPDKVSNYYRFEKIYGPTEYNLDLKSPLARPDIKIKESDYLLAINGHEIRVPDDYFKYLQVLPDQEVTITVNDKPVMQGSQTYTIKPIRNSSQLRYFRWLTDNIDKVLKATDGQVGYMHINAMGSGGIGEFDKFWRAFRYKKGLIIDVRRNSGGWTEYFMIDKLERKMTAYNVLKGMEPFRYPGSVSNGQFVVVSNEYNGSDGEAFVEHFKARKLGTVVGVPSWGGLVGIINGQTTIDNGNIHQSNNAFYGREGKWLVENHGADPDIYIDNDPASVMAGKDRQLEKAIETVLQKIKEHPFVFPERPSYPVR